VTPHKRTASLFALLLLLALPNTYGEKAPLTLDDFFESVEIRSIQISPSGHEVLVETVRRDRPANRYRNDLWLYRDTDSAGNLARIASK
jgi:hypothetical protein